MKIKKTNIKHVGPDKYLSEAQYYKVDTLSSTGIVVKNDRGLRFTVDNDIVEEGMYSADQFTEEEKVTKTEMAELFSLVGDTIFTVNFNKQIDAKLAKEGLLHLYANKNGQLISEREFQSKVKSISKSIFKGEERMLIGYKIGTDPNLGRSHVIDLQADKGTNTSYDGRHRQIDHRSINWLIHKNKKYIVK